MTIASPSIRTPANQGAPFPLRGEGRSAGSQSLGLPVISLPPEVLADQPNLTHSDRVQTMHRTGSIAEAAAGPDSRLRAPCAVSADRTATAAIAEAAQS
jgi:cobalt-precorrin 5A hydrolase